MTRSVAQTTKVLLSEITPPVLYRGLRRLRHNWKIRVSGEQPWGLRPAGWYDGVYAKSTEYGKHYAESCYYFLWTVVADRMMRAEVARVLDLGCGPGQFAQLLKDRGLRQYRGLDFSSQSIDLARGKCPGFVFEVADICASDSLQSRDYDCVVALEFLEHVEDDLKILGQIKPGTPFYGSVPNFPDVAHVRHFSDEASVRNRYEGCFATCRVDSFVADPSGKTYFLIEGTTR